MPDKSHGGGHEADREHSVRGECPQGPRYRSHLAHVYGSRSSAFRRSSWRQESFTRMAQLRVGTGWGRGRGTAQFATNRAAPLMWVMRGICGEPHASIVRAELTAVLKVLKVTARGIKIMVENAKKKHKKMEEPNFLECCSEG